MPTLARRTFLGRLLALAGGLLASGPLGRALADDDDDGYAVDEWGVFLLSGDLPSGRAIDLTTDAPAFACAPRRDRTEFLRALHEAEQTPVIVDKPVVYFRSGRPRRVRATVDLAGGRPLLWWPPADWSGSTLSWEVAIGGPRGEPTRPVEAGHWWSTLRETDAADVVVGPERERFLYYDGETTLTNRLAVAVEGGRLVVTSGYDHPIEDVEFVWIDRADGRLRLAAGAARLAPGASIELPLDAPTESPAATGPARLARALEGAGLAATEVESFVAVWGEEFFARPGLSIAFRLPRAIYDALLPIRLDPPPAALTRIGYCLAVDLDPDLAARIDALVAALGADDWKTRQAAATDLSNLGPTALPALRRAAEGAGDLHLRSEAARLSDRIAARLDPDAIPERYRQHYDEWKRTGRVAPESLWGERGLGRR